jgi:hypothetical protein
MQLGSLVPTRLHASRLIAPQCPRDRPELLRPAHAAALQAFMGHRSIANTVVYTAVADKRIGNIWGK